MDNRLYALKHTLNQIEVSGEDNLDKLLGCIQTVQHIIDDERKQEAQTNEQNPVE